MLVIDDVVSDCRDRQHPKSQTAAPSQSESRVHALPEVTQHVPSMLSWNPSVLPQQSAAAPVGNQHVQAQEDWSRRVSQHREGPVHASWTDAQIVPPQLPSAHGNPLRPFQSSVRALSLQPADAAATALAGYGLRPTARMESPIGGGMRVSNRSAQGAIHRS